MSVNFTVQRSGHDQELRYRKLQSKPPTLRVIPVPSKKGRKYSNFVRQFCPRFWLERRMVLAPGLEGELEVSIDCDEAPLTEYQHSIEGHSASCWVASEENKVFFLGVQRPILTS